MVTAPNRLQNYAMNHDLSDFRVKRWLTVDHTVYLTWLEVEEGKTLSNLQMNREHSEITLESIPQHIVESRQFNTTLSQFSCGSCNAEQLHMHETRPKKKKKNANDKPRI